MSDDWIRIVPAVPEHVPDAERVSAVLAVLARLMPDAEEIEVETADAIQFLDAGANWSGARCADCGSDLDDGWWSAAMTASHEHSAFTQRLVAVPCCGADRDLNDLDFGDWPVAFARWWVDCMNPKIGQLDETQVSLIASALEQPVRIVYQHI